MEEMGLGKGRVSREGLEDDRDRPVPTERLVGRLGLGHIVELGLVVEVRREGAVVSVGSVDMVDDVGVFPHGHTADEKHGYREHGHRCHSATGCGDPLHGLKIASAEEDQKKTVGHTVLVARFLTTAVYSDTLIQLG